VKSEAEVATLTAVYDAVEPEELRAALASLASQTRRPDQCVVVADGPLPSGLERVLDEFSRLLPLRVVRLERHSGSGPAKQAGLVASTSRYVAIADADDISRPERLAVQLALLGRGYDLVGSSMEEFDGASGRVLGIRRFPADHEHIVVKLRRINPLNHPSVMMSRARALAAGGYTDLPYLEDYDLWARMVAGGARLANAPDALVRFRGGEPALARRRSHIATRSEWTLQRNLISYGIVSRRGAAWNLITRSAFRVLPRGLIRRAYARLFLTSHDHESAGGDPAPKESPTASPHR
jgi:glycosyltransferase involved in cell wall biosynthesis